MPHSHHAELWGGPRCGELLHVPSGPDGRPQAEIIAYRPNETVFASGLPDDAPAARVGGVYTREEIAKRQAGTVWLYTWKER